MKGFEIFLFIGFHSYGLLLGICLCYNETAPPCSQVWVLGLIQLNNLSVFQKDEVRKGNILWHKKPK